MAQTVYLSTPPLDLPGFPSALGGVPASPDPAPLRMLAFSVAEAALETDPNSPSFLHSLQQDSMHMASIDAALNEAAAAIANQSRAKARWSGSEWSSPPKKSNLWNVVEKAKERRQPAPAPVATSPPVSPASYKFVLPAHSPLAASIERSHRPPTLSSTRRTLETRSAEPSPVTMTFAGLDQSRPPPEFVPRLSAEEFSAQSEKASSVKHVRTKSDESLRAVMAKSSASGSRQRMKIPLPSLKQIQAKLNLERAASARAAAASSARDGSASPENIATRPRSAQRTNSDDSVEIIQTPTEERPSLAILSRRPSSPPSPQVMEAQQQQQAAKAPSACAAPRLAPFLRERTSGRLALSTLSTYSTPQAKQPVLTVTPPSCERRAPAPRLDFSTPSRCVSTPPTLGRRVVTSPTASRFPPLSDFARYSPHTPSSPTGSAGGATSPSMPIITCTPAPVKVVKDGVEQDSDEEGDDVVVFDGEMEEARERQERERRAKQMKDRLKLRRGSD